jgi:lipopolysaccharide exporter
VLSSAATSALTFVVAPRRPRPAWDRLELATIWGFTRYLLANSLIIYALLNLDDLLVARLVGTAALGVYSMSYTMVNSSVLFVTRPLGELLLPTMARLLEDKAAFTRATQAAVSAFASISWGIIAPLWVLTHDLFAVLAGASQWQEAAPIFRALLPFVLIRGINQSLGSMVVASGRPGVLTVISGTQLLLMVPCAYVGLSLAGFLGLTVAITVLNAGAMVALVLLAPAFIQVKRHELLLLIGAPALPALAAAFAGSLLMELFTLPALRLAFGASSALLLYFVLWEVVCGLGPLRALGVYPPSRLRKSLSKR